MRTPLVGNPFANFTLACALMVSLSACGGLKTRQQMQDEDGEGHPSSPVPANVKSVEPQGGYVVDELKTEITRLNGRLEDLERSQRQSATAASSSPSKDEIRKLEQRVAELEQAQAIMLENMKKVLESAAPADPEETFTKAKSQFEAANYESAAEQLTQYLKVPKARHTEDATMLRAEAYYALKQFKKAIVDYSQFPEKYKKSSYVPRALYKIGLSFESLGMKDDARSFYQELTEKYPKSPEAKKARAKLK